MKELIFKIEMGKSTVMLRWKDTYSISKNKKEKREEEFNTVETVKMEEKIFFMTVSRMQQFIITYISKQFNGSEI